MTRMRFCYLLIFISLFPLVSASHGETIYRCASTNNELILALDEAANSNDNFVIQIVKGFYNAEFVYSSTNLSNLAIKGGYSSNVNPCDTRDADPSPADTVLDGSAAHRTLGLVTTATSGPVDFSIDSLTIQNGDGLNAGGLYIKAEEANVTLENSIVKLNTRGGIYTNTRGNVNFSKNKIINNSGGGARINGFTGNVTIDQNTITDNENSSAGGGISIYTSSRSVKITNNIISNNMAPQGKGGGIHVAAQGVLIDDNLISQNTGGGIYSLPWWTSIQYNITEITNNSILHNSNGPGIRFDVISSSDIFFDRLTLTNNVIANNSAGHATRGGGIDLAGSHPEHVTTLTNNTITGNTSIGDGGGVKIRTGRRDNQQHNFYSNIITNNTAAGLGDDIYIDNDEDQNLIYSKVTMLNNDFNQSAEGFFIKEPAFTLQIDPSNLNNQNPLFVAQQTDDFHLGAGSPCINTGNNLAPDILLYDRDGSPRTMDGSVDIGAYEYSGVILPVALFSEDSAGGTIPLTVNFVDQSIGDITNWSWIFGDGTTSSEQNPSHTYNEAGLYSVSLTVTGPNGSAMKTKNSLITVDLAPPQANAGPDRSVSQGSIILDGSGSSDVDGTIDSYTWVLHHRTDSSFDLLASGVTPEITGLHSGFYDVQLTVTDDDGLTDTDNLLLSVSEPWDVNNDQALGLEEVIYILKMLTENN